MADVVRLDMPAVVSPPLGLIVTVVTFQHKIAVFPQHVGAQVASATSLVVTLRAGPLHAFVH